MYPVFESIKVDAIGLHNWQYHAARMQRTSLQLWGEVLSLEEIEAALNDIKTNNCLKCRVRYNRNSFEIETSVYHKRTIDKLILVEDDMIEYPLKYTDRTCFQPKLSSDKYTEMIYCKNGYLTDSSYSNVILWNGFEWHTPDSPLLLGTKRAFLLDQGLIHEKRIEINSLENYQSISLINAMLDIGDIELNTSSIILANLE